MRLLHSAPVVIALLLAATQVHAQRQVQLLATVTDPNGGAIAAVTAADVRVSENGVAGTIVKIEPVNRVSKVQVLVDNGVGIPPESFGDLRKGLLGLLEAIPEGVETALVTTAPQPRFIERGTTDRQKLLKAVDLVAPDGGAGRFVESLAEATERMERDKQDSNYVIVSIATTSGDAAVRESDINRTLQRLSKGRARVHVVLLAGRIGTTLSAGGVQSEMGEAAAQVTRGRFERLNVANRLATLLPEIGAEMAKTLGQGSRQFRITVDRPGGASGDLGKVTIGVSGLLVSSVAVESR